MLKVVLESFYSLFYVLNRNIFYTCCHHQSLFLTGEMVEFETSVSLKVLTHEFEVENVKVTIGYLKTQKIRPRSPVGLS